MGKPRKIPANERPAVRDADATLRAIEKIATSSKKKAREPQLAMAYIDAERRKARALATAILEVQDEEQERWTPSETVVELARLVLSVVSPEPEDADYDAWATGDARARGRR